MSTKGKLRVAGCVSWRVITHSVCNYHSRGTRRALFRCLRTSGIAIQGGESTESKWKTGVCRAREVALEALNVSTHVLGKPVCLIVGG